MALINPLPLSTVPEDGGPCPLPVGHLSLTFRARPGGPALAVALTNVGCGGVSFTVNGRPEPLLADDEPTLIDQSLKLAGLPPIALMSGAGGRPW